MAEWTRPAGGYFVSLDVLDGCARESCGGQGGRHRADPGGCVASPGQDPRDRNIRIAPTFPDLDTVRVAAEGVALSVLLVTSRALLAERGVAASAQA